MTHIALDTNIFEHLLNRSKEWNEDGHVSRLLDCLQANAFELCVDDKGKIAGEYSTMIVPIIASRDEEGIERYVLSYWMLYCERRNVPMDLRDTRTARIRSIIPIHESVDQAFVYVVCAEDCKLITNDDVHILSHRSELRKRTKQYRGNNTDFISSRQAVDQLIPATPAS